MKPGAHGLGLGLVAGLRQIPRRFGFRNGRFNHGCAPVDLIGQEATVVHEYNYRGFLERSGFLAEAIETLSSMLAQRQDKRGA